MAGMASMAFGGNSSAYSHAPRHIPVHDVEEAFHHKAEPLTGYMIDPRYLPHDEQPQNLGAPSSTTTRTVPALTPLAVAQNRVGIHRAPTNFSGMWSRAGRLGTLIIIGARAGWRSLAAASERVGRNIRQLFNHGSSDTASPVAYQSVDSKDWRRVVFPVAAMLFIIGLGVANGLVRTTAPAPRSQTARQQATHQTPTTPSPNTTTTTNSNNSTSPTGQKPTPANQSTTQQPTVGSSGSQSSTSAVGGQGGGTATTQSPANPQSASGTSSNPTLVGGRGGGDTSRAVPPGASVTVTPTNVAPMPGK